MNGCVNEWANERMNGCADERVRECTNARLNECADERVRGWADERINETTGLHPVLGYWAPSGPGGLVLRAGI